MYNQLARLKSVRTGTQFLILFQIYGNIGTNTVAAILTGVSLIIVAFRIAISLYFLPSTSIRYFMIVSIDRSGEKKTPDIYPHV